MTTEEKRSYLGKMRRHGGYILDMHKILVSADFDWVQAYDPFAEATYTGQRLLDRIRLRSFCRSLSRPP